MLAIVLWLVLLSSAPQAGLLAPICGIAAGGYFAGKWAKHDTLYHGALTAAGYVALEAIGVLPTPFAPTTNALEDSVAIIVSDALLLSVGAAAGWLAGRGAPWSSSGRDRAR